MNVLEEIKMRKKALEGSYHKGQFSGLSSGAVAIGVLILVLTMMAVVTQGVNDAQTADTYADNISTAGLVALDSMSDLVEPLALVIIAAVIIGVLVAAFGRRG